jgi:nitrilase
MTDTGARMRVAAVQTVSGGDVDADLAQAEPLIRRAAAEGARLVVCRNTSAFSARARPTSWRSARRTARAGSRRSWPARTGHAIWLVGGTVPIASGDPGRCAVRAWSTGPTGGALRATTRSTCSPSRGERYDEGRTIEPGTETVAIDLPCGRSGCPCAMTSASPSSIVPWERWRSSWCRHSAAPAPPIGTCSCAPAPSSQCYLLAAAQGEIRRAAHVQAFRADRPVRAIVAEHDQGRASSSATSIRNAFSRAR